jgi:hypothetical protein
MSGYGYREAVLQLDAALWRKRVIFDAESAEGRAAADAHQVPIELIVVAAARIAGYIARGEVVVNQRDTIGALCGPGQTRRVVRYLAERGHVAGRGRFNPNPRRAAGRAAPAGIAPRAFAARVLSITGFC